MTTEESQDLGDLLEQLLDGDMGIMRGGATALPLDDLLLRCSYKTGSSSSRAASRTALDGVCEDAVRQGGGRCEEDITEHTDYCVVGTFGSRDWTHSNWGREVAEAVGVPHATRPTVHRRRGLLGGFDPHGVAVSLDRAHLRARAQASALTRTNPWRGDPWSRPRAQRGHELSHGGDPDNAQSS